MPVLARTTGKSGNVARRFFAGPGINNFNVALAKNTRFGERYNLEFRLEFFNVFNHTQFGNVQGNFNAPTQQVTSGAGTTVVPTFGQILTARDPRIGQLALKFAF